MTRLDHAKYPFTNEASEYVKSLSIDVKDLASSEFSVVLDIAEKRIFEALTTGKIDWELQGDVEILAYPAALMLVALGGDERAQRRYALAESKRAYELLKQEQLDMLLQIAQHTFNWNAKIADRQIGEVRYEFALHYSDYLRNAVKIRDPDWKLTNKVLEQGYVYCTKDQFARLLEVEVDVKVLSRIIGHSASVPEAIARRVERIRRIAGARARAYAMEEAPQAVLAAAMPPCMKALLANVTSGKQVPHMGRFALTAFLSNIGVTDEEIIKALRASPDFNERIARYQVEHISGKRGGKKKYTPPNCKTMKTHGLCINPDELCATISNPLAYYRKKARKIAAAARKTRTAGAPRSAV